MNVKKSWKNKIQGWFPQEPLHKNYVANVLTQPKTKAELDKKLFKNGWVANSIIVSVFLGVNAFIIQPSYNYHVSIELTAIALGTFLLTLATANLLIYWRYKKQLPAKEAQ
jgi:hypothetical protein